MVFVPLECSQPLRALKMSEEQLHAVVQAGIKVCSVYEAGLCGYGLHRGLVVIEATNYIISPKALGDGRGQKTMRWMPRRWWICSIGMFAETNARIR